MAIRDLAVAYDASETAEAALGLAITMCRKYGASLTGLHARAPVKFEHRIERWIGSQTIAALKETEQAAAEAVELQFAEGVKAHGFSGPVTFVAEEGTPNDVLSRLSRFHDIMLMGQFSDPVTEQGELRAERIVLDLGRPLIVVPKGYTLRPLGEYAAVAWDGSRAAARALSDAMQILETKQRLDILTVASGANGAQSGGLEEIVRHLARHGVEARLVHLRTDRAGIGATILDYCSEKAPDVLVMGAYGNAKLKEDLFGGTTRHVLHHMVVPVLMAH